MKITLELAGGGEGVVDLDQITEYGSACDIKDLSQSILGYDPFLHFTPVNKRFYIKVAPFDDIIYITPESLKYVAKQKEK